MSEESAVKILEKDNSQKLIRCTASYKEGPIHINETSHRVFLNLKQIPIDGSENMPTLWTWVGAKAAEEAKAV